MGKSWRGLDLFGSLQLSDCGDPRDAPIFYFSPTLSGPASFSLSYINARLGRRRCRCFGMALFI